jgi:prepilin-type N-terminal cleavage/methylation domain-containing protein
MKAARHHTNSGEASRAFTIVEVLMAIAIFGLVVLAIYETWMAVVNGSRAGLKAAAQAQRARISIKAIEDALVTAQMFSANGKHYWFVAETTDGKCGRLSFVARLPSSFPGAGHYGDQSRVRRVEFFADAEGNLTMTQLPMMSGEKFEDQEVKPHAMQLAKDVTLFMFEFWDERKKEYTSDWAASNALPKIVRVALGLGSAGRNSQAPQDLVTRTIAMPCMAIPGQWQAAVLPPGGPGMPGVPMPPGMQPGLPGMQPGGRPGLPTQPGRPGGGQRF